jgi:CHASE2 domain-containing sensor protein
MRSRPTEIQDEKILVIEVDGFKEPDRSNKTNTLSDDRLETLLQKIFTYQPKIVGIDNFLSHEIDPKKHETLYESLLTGNLVTACQAQVNNSERFKAPKNARSFGFGNISVDNDRIVRRHLLSMAFNSGFCTKPYAFSALLANQYFEDTDPRKPQLDKGRIGKKQLNFLTNNMGGKSIYPDFYETPYGKIPGVFLQAQMTSQLVNAALYNRPLIWAYPFWGEIPMILLASVTGALLSWRVRKVWILLGCGGGAISILFFGSVKLLEQVGYWFPLVPVGLGFTIVCISVTIYLFRETKPE